MENVIVTYTKLVQIDFNELIEILFNDEYFLYRDNAIKPEQLGMFSFPKKIQPI
ncbi:MAG: hypothetical protein H7174_09445 [Flavobacterium sp.]|nr:hypothetical protein [Flavobacterium sp.]